MMQDFFPRSPGLLGIDIGSSSIKLLELARTQKTLTVKNYAIVSFTEKRLEPGARREEIVADSLQKALQQANTRTRNAALAIPLSESISKTISLPAQRNEESLQASIEQAADQQLPYSLDELYWDYEVQEAIDERVNVLLVASRREYVEDRVAAAEMAGLKIRIVDMEIYAQEKAVIRMVNADDASFSITGLLDIGDTCSRFSVISQNKTLYSSLIHCGGQPADEAPQLHPPFSDSLPSSFLDTHGSLLAEQLQRTLRSYLVACPENHLDRLYLCGGGALRARLDQYLADVLHIPVMVANPLTGISLASHIPPDTLMSQSPCLLTACGLALRSFDA